jgi:type II secretory pathway pseudopilin PulG
VEKRSEKNARPVKKKPVGPIVGIAIVAVALLAGFIYLIVSQMNISQARRDVGYIAAALDLFERENGRYPTGTYPEICAILQGQDVGGQNPKKLDYLESAGSPTGASGEFLDPWKTPYRISVNSSGRAWSCGPNRKDENGDGDDIASWKLPPIDVTKF